MFVGPVSESLLIADQDPTVSAADLSSQVARVAAPLRAQVLELLRREIVELRLRPGQRLVERDLVERIGVSRTTVREVLRELAAEGLVTTIPQKGTIVAAPSPKEASELYEVRALLEGVAAKQFCEHASEDQLRRLRGAFGALEACGEDPAVLIQNGDKIYEVIFEGAGNETIRSILGSLQARVAVLRRLTMSTPGRSCQSIDEIRAIVEAAERRDGDAAAEAAADHVRKAAATLRHHNDAEGSHL